MQGQLTLHPTHQVRLAEVLMKAHFILEQPPAQDARTRYNSYCTKQIFELLNDLGGQLGPYGSVLKHLVEQLYLFVYSDQRQAMDIPVNALPISAGPPTILDLQADITHICKPTSRTRAYCTLPLSTLC